MADINTTDLSEEWRPVPRGYSDTYDVSNLGRVRRKNGSLRKSCIARTGYYVICLVKPGPRQEGKWPARDTQFIHRLVAEAFLGPCPEGHQVNHKDGDKLNNHLDNLEYVTPRENTHHAWRLGMNYWRGEHCNLSKLTRLQVKAIRDLHATGHYTQSLIGELFGVKRSTIGLIVNGVNWKEAD